MLRSLSCVVVVCSLVVTTMVAAADPVAEQVAAMQGSWTMTQLQYEGEDLADRIKLKFTFADDLATVQGNGEITAEYGKIQFRFDPSTTPKCLDLIVTSGSSKDVKMEGIYEMVDGKLRVCLRPMGNTRPTEFKAEAGSELVIFTLARSS